MQTTPLFEAIQGLAVSTPPPFVFSLKICRSDLSVTIILLIIKEVTIMIQRKLIQRHSSRS